MSGIELIAQERQEQIEKHGRNIERDVIENNHYQLSEAAGLLTALDMDEMIDQDGTYPAPVEWETELWQKMCQKDYKERLIIAGALIAAEIDRLQAK